MWNRHTYRPLFLALLLSLLTHFALLGELPGWFGHDKDATSPIQVNLVELPPTPLPPPVPHRPPPPAAKRQATPKPQTVAQPVPPQPLPQPAPEAAPPPVMAANTPPMPIEPPPAVEPAPPAESVVPQPDEKPVVAEDTPPPTPPRHVEVEYRILRKGGVAGIERHSYRVEGDHYSLSSIAQAKGLLALALSDLVQKSEGAVTPQGLRPATFLYQYGKDKAQKATFDWQAGTLQMEVGAKRQSVPLTDGSQDLMSFMYQFMFVPPLQEMRLAITNGKRLRTYDYAFEGEETLDTSMGALRCLHISRGSDDGNKKTELWLAEDYHYLPVRMKETDKDGVVTERVANRLQME